METLQISTDFIKLDSALKLSALVGSGGEAKSVIRDGYVKVNGEICVQRGKKLRIGDTVELMNNVIKIAGA
ncbi:MAG: RNA-binding S4 domain-containing protein [Oscillospiraceae bacterium]